MSEDGRGVCVNAARKDVWGKRGWFRCSVCGCRVEEPTYEIWEPNGSAHTFIYRLFNYCPCCGRKVMR